MNAVVQPDKVTIDLRAGSVTVEDATGARSHLLASAEGFSAVADAWLRCGWDAKYMYRFTWLGRPIIQMPDDVMRLQELVWRARPDVIIETGVAHGGSLMLHASVLHALGGGRVIGIDVEIRPHNRVAIEAHELAGMITLVEGDSAAPDVAERVRALVGRSDRVFVVLDAKHTRDHVRAELELYAPLIGAGSYLVAMDGIIERLAGAPRTAPAWVWDNPAGAVRDYVAEHSEFALVDPEPLFNEGSVRAPVTFALDGVIERGPQ